MKRLIIALLAVSFLLQYTSAQEVDEQDWKEFKQSVKDELDVDFLTWTIEALDLTDEEKEGFADVMEDYMRKQARLVRKKTKLIEEYQEEMKEDDSAKDEAEETEDFVEDFWEVDIDLMELRKDYFDKFENVVGLDKAFNFFLLENEVRNRLITKRVYHIVPMVIQIDADSGEKDSDRYSSSKSSKEMSDKAHQKSKTGKTYAKKDASVKGTHGNAVEDYNSWCDMSKDKDFSGHHADIRSGITKIVSAIDHLADESGATLSDWSTKRQKILAKAEKLDDDPKSDNHADWAEEIFAMTGEALESLAKSPEVAYKGMEVKQACEAIEKIDPDTLLGKQDQQVHEFFVKTRKAINALEAAISEKNTDADKRSN